MLVYVFLHDREAWCHLISEHSAVHASSHEVAHHSILIKATEQLVMEVRMMRTHLILHHQLALFQQVFWRGGLIANSEINFLLKFLRQAEVDNGFACRQGFLNVV